MDFLEDFQANLEILPALLHRNYATMRDLDKSLQALQKQNEQRCDQEINCIKSRIESRRLAPNATATVAFSDEALDEQKHCVRIADEKLALANQAYDMIDAQIQMLDEYMRKFEELRQAKEATAGTSSSSVIGSARHTRGDGNSKGGRNRAKPVIEPPSISLDLPIDPHEPKYCFCNQVSFGEMIACDNPSCKIEWFHFVCVGLKDKPNGKWYCSSCAGIKKYRKGK